MNLHMLFSCRLTFPHMRSDVFAEVKKLSCVSTAASSGMIWFQSVTCPPPSSIRFSENKELLASMQENALGCARPSAAAEMARVVMDLAKLKTTNLAWWRLSKYGV